MSKSAYPDIGYLRYIATNAGQLMRLFFYETNVRQWKKDGTPVTDADEDINQMVLNYIARDFPHINAIGEEGSHEVPGAEYTVTWDPLDGTFAFMVGSAISTFCISVLKGDTPLSAVIYDPLSFRLRLWHAEQGKGAFMNGSGPIHVSTHDSLERAQICMAWWRRSPYNIHKAADKLLGLGANIHNAISIVYYGALIASGTVEAVIFPGDKIWEAAAIKCLVEEAGGRATDIYGEPLRFSEGRINGLIASNGVIHEDLVNIIRECQ